MQRDYKKPNNKMTALHILKRFINAFFLLLRTSVVFIQFGKPLFHYLLVMQHSFSPPELSTFDKIARLKVLGAVS